MDTTANSPTAQPNIPQQILCVCCSQYDEWDRENVIMTGSADGVVRMWSIDYVEVAESEKRRKAEAGRENRAKTSAEAADAITNLAKKMSLSLSGDCLSSVREAIAQSRASERSEPSSDTEEVEEDLEEAEEAVEGKGEKMPAPDAASTNDLLEGQEEEEEEESPSKDNGRQPPSPCITKDDFVVVPKEEVGGGAGEDGEGARRPNDGYDWMRRLVFRAKLTMHTAFERPDNVEPAAVTALAISRDHRTIYVGDEKGRVFSWAISSKPGKGTC